MKLKPNVVLKKGVSIKKAPAPKVYPQRKTKNA